MEEKRRFQRVKLQVPISYQAKGNLLLEKAISSDISLGGLNFIDYNFITPHTEINLEINISSRLLKPKSLVRWSMPLAHSDRYKSGIEFLELADEEKKYLEDFLALKIF